MDRSTLVCIIYVLYMYYIICIRSAFAGFSWVFGVRGDFCMCFCLFLLAFLGFFLPRRFLYVLLLAFAGFSWVFLGFLRPRRFLCVLLLAFLGFWRPRRFLCVLLIDPKRNEENEKLLDRQAV